MNSKELSSLSALSRITKLGTIGIVIIAGLVSMVTIFYFSIDKHKQESAIKAQLHENVNNINKSSIAVKERASEIKVLIEETENEELKIKIEQYQKEVEKLIKQSIANEKLLTNDVQGSVIIPNFEFNLISVAHAQKKSESTIKKQHMLWAVLILLALVYLGALYSLFLSRNPRNIDIATDLVKTLTGFYIGIATSVVA